MITKELLWLSVPVPAELIKARMQTQAFRSIGLCLKDAVAMERGGLRGLYTGYAATMVRDLPYFALQLGFYGKYSCTLLCLIFYRDRTAPCSILYSRQKPDHWNQKNFSFGSFKHNDLYSKQNLLYFQTTSKTSWLRDFSASGLTEKGRQSTFIMPNMELRDSSRRSCTYWGIFGWTLQWSTCCPAYRLASSPACWPTPWMSSQPVWWPRRRISRRDYYLASGHQLELRIEDSVTVYCGWRERKVLGPSW